MLGMFTLGGAIKTGSGVGAQWGRAKIPPKPQPPQHCVGELSRATVTRMACNMTGTLYQSEVELPVSDMPAGDVLALKHAECRQ
jgi:hypothetical protein